MSTRRTTKLTARPISPTAHYVAVQCNQIAPGVDRVTCGALHDLRITDHRGSEFVDIHEGEAYDLVRSVSLGDNLFYIVTSERCSCPATTEYCKHRPRPITEQIAAAPIIEEQTSKGTSSGTQIAVPRTDLGARGTISSCAKGSFADIVYGNSKEMAKYRNAYLESKQRGSL